MEKVTPKTRWQFTVIGPILDEYYLKLENTLRKPHSDISSHWWLLTIVLFLAILSPQGLAQRAERLPDRVSTEQVFHASSERNAYFSLAKAISSGIPYYFERQHLLRAAVYQTRLLLQLNTCHFDPLRGLALLKFSQLKTIPAETPAPKPLTA